MEMYYHRSIRLKEYDYSRPGAYFVTICTENRKCYFGNIVNGKMMLNDCGDVVKEYCQATENHFQNIKFDSFIIMPNHFHVIIKIIGIGIPARTLGQIVGFFKYGVSKRINCIRKTPGVKLWQRNYYEHIIRNKNEYDRISKYIENNPIKWELDFLNSGINPVVDAGFPRTNGKNTHFNTTKSNVGNSNICKK